MPHIKPGDYRPGQPYRPGMFQDLADAVRGAIPKRVMGRGRRLTRHGWEMDQDEESQILNAKSPPGGIDGMVGMVPGFATCTLLGWDDDALVMTSMEVKVFNLSVGAVGGNKVIMIALVDGHYEVVMESC